MSQKRISRQYNKLYFEDAHTLAGQAATRSSDLDLQLHCPPPQKTTLLYIQFVFA